MNTDISCKPAKRYVGKRRAKRKGKEDKIVNRELAQVFTNGTIVDATYLTSDDPNHCVAIKVGPSVCSHVAAR